MCERRFLSQCRIAARVDGKSVIVTKRIKQQIAPHRFGAGDFQEPIRKPDAELVHGAAGLVEIALGSFEIVLRDLGVVLRLSKCG